MHFIMPWLTHKDNRRYDCRFAGFIALTSEPQELLNICDKDVIYCIKMVPLCNEHLHVVCAAGRR